MTPRIGSLFSGYGGLDLAVEAVTGGRTVWHVEQEPHAAAVLAAHWPGVPNLGDITSVDWSTVPPVDILCGGFPCQDISTAGKRAGLKEGTRSGLWFKFADAIGVLRPHLVVVENVRAILRRGLDTVLGDLAALGYDAEWGLVRASEVGAPHRRERWFLVAHPHGDATGWDPRDAPAPQASDIPRLQEGDGPWPGSGVRPSPHGWVCPDSVLLPQPLGSITLPTPRAQNGDPRNSRLWVRPVGQPQNLENALAHTSRTHKLLPTPIARDGRRMSFRRIQETISTGKDPKGQLENSTYIFGQFAEAVKHWESLTRPAPAPCCDPCVPPDKKRELNPRFVEWMMGLPDGWVTDHTSRLHALRILGNGVVPQQAAHALTQLLPRLSHA